MREGRRPYQDVFDRRLPAGFGRGWTDDRYGPEGGGVPAELELLWAADSCRREVSRGGFVAFFMNDAGKLAPEAAAGFRLIGLDDCAALVERAMSYFGEPYPRSQAGREAVYASPAAYAAWRESDPSGETDPHRRSPFDGLDTRFFAATKGGRFEAAADRAAEPFAGS